ncbi:Uncharacterized protein GBIM_14615, partial [Gryllus bimaculatus]
SSPKPADAETPASKPTVAATQALKPAVAVTPASKPADTVTPTLKLAVAETSALKPVDTDTPAPKTADAVTTAPRTADAVTTAIKTVDAVSPPKTDFAVTATLKPADAVTAASRPALKPDAAAPPSKRPADAGTPAPKPTDDAGTFATKLANAGTSASDTSNSKTSAPKPVDSETLTLKPADAPTPTPNAADAATEPKKPSNAGTPAQTSVDVKTSAQKLVDAGASTQKPVIAGTPVPKQADTGTPGSKSGNTIIQAIKSPDAGIPAKKPAEAGTPTKKPADAGTSAQKPGIVGTSIQKPPAVSPPTLKTITTRTPAQNLISSGIPVQKIASGNPTQKLGNARTEEVQKSTIGTRVEKLSDAEISSGKSGPTKILAQVSGAIEIPSRKAITSGIDQKSDAAGTSVLAVSVSQEPITAETGEKPLTECMPVPVSVAEPIQKPAVETQKAALTESLPCTVVKKPPAGIGDAGTQLQRTVNMDLDVTKPTAEVLVTSDIAGEQLKSTSEDNSIIVQEAGSFGSDAEVSSPHKNPAKKSAADHDIKQQSTGDPVQEVGAQVAIAVTAATKQVVFSKSDEQPTVSVSSMQKSNPAECTAQKIVDTDTKQPSSVTAVHKPSETKLEKSSESTKEPKNVGPITLKAAVQKETTPTKLLTFTAPQKSKVQELSTLKSIVKKETSVQKTDDSSTEELPKNFEKVTGQKKAVRKLTSTTSKPSAAGNADEKSTMDPDQKTSLKEMVIEKASPGKSIQEQSIEDQPPAILKLVSEEETQKKQVTSVHSEPKENITPVFQEKKQEISGSASEAFQTAMQKTESPESVVTALKQSPVEPSGSQKTDLTGFSLEKQSITEKASEQTMRGTKVRVQSSTEKISSTKKPDEDLTSGKPESKGSSTGTQKQIDVSWTTQIEESVSSALTPTASLTADSGSEKPNTPEKSKPVLAEEQQINVQQSKTSLQEFQEQKSPVPGSIKQKVENKSNKLVVATSVKSPSEVSLQGQETSLVSHPETAEETVLSEKSVEKIEKTSTAALSLSKESTEDICKPVLASSIQRTPGGRLGIVGRPPIGQRPSALASLQEKKTELSPRIAKDTLSWKLPTASASAKKVPSSVGKVDEADVKKATPSLMSESEDVSRKRLTQPSVSSKQVKGGEVSIIPDDSDDGSEPELLDAKIAKDVSLPLKEKTEGASVTSLPAPQVSEGQDIKPASKEDPEPCTLQKTPKVPKEQQTAATTSPMIQKTALTISKAESSVEKSEKSEVLEQSIRKTAPSNEFSVEQSSEAAPKGLLKTVEEGPRDQEVSSSSSSPRPSTSSYKIPSVKSPLTIKVEDSPVAGPKLSPITLKRKKDSEGKGDEYISLSPKLDASRETEKLTLKLKRVGSPTVRELESEDRDKFMLKLKKDSSRSDSVVSSTTASTSTAPLDTCTKDSEDVEPKVGKLMLKLKDTEKGIVARISSPKGETDEEPKVEKLTLKLKKDAGDVQLSPSTSAKSEESPKVEKLTLKIRVDSPLSQETAGDVDEPKVEKLMLKLKKDSTDMPSPKEKAVLDASKTEKLTLRIRKDSGSQDIALTDGKKSEPAEITESSERITLTLVKDSSNSVSVKEKDISESKIEPDICSEEKVEKLTLKIKKDSSNESAEKSSSATIVLEKVEPKVEKLTLKLKSAADDSTVQTKEEEIGMEAKKGKEEDEKKEDKKVEKLTLKIKKDDEKEGSESQKFPEEKKLEERTAKPKKEPTDSVPSPKVSETSEKFQKAEKVEKLTLKIPKDVTSPKTQGTPSLAETQDQATTSQPSSTTTRLLSPVSKTSVLSPTSKTSLPSPVSITNLPSPVSKTSLQSPTPRTKVLSPVSKTPLSASKTNLALPGGDEAKTEKITMKFKRDVSPGLSPEEAAVSKPKEPTVVLSEVSILKTVPENIAKKGKDEGQTAVEGKSEKPFIKRRRESVKQDNDDCIILETCPSTKEKSVEKPVLKTPESERKSSGSESPDPSKLTLKLTKSTSWCVQQPSGADVASSVPRVGSPDIQEIPTKRQKVEAHSEEKISITTTPTRSQRHREELKALPSLSEVSVSLKRHDLGRSETASGSGSKKVKVEEKLTECTVVVQEVCLPHTKREPRLRSPPPSVSLTKIPAGKGSASRSDDRHAASASGSGSTTVLDGKLREILSKIGGKASALLDCDVSISFASQSDKAAAPPAPTLPSEDVEIIMVPGGNSSGGRGRGRGRGRGHSHRGAHSQVYRPHAQAAAQQLVVEPDIINIEPVITLDTGEGSGASAAASPAAAGAGS